LSNEISLVEEREKKRLAAQLHDSSIQKLNLAQDALVCRSWLESGRDETCLAAPVANIYNAGTTRLHCLHMTQYTVRNVPDEIDRALRARAHRERKSLNQLTLDLLVEAVGHGREKRSKRDLSKIAGHWADDAETEQALEDQRKIDPELWR
jgi:plasmid stability protein